MLEDTFGSISAAIEGDVNNFLPGQKYDADDQCYISLGTPACGNVSCQSFCLQVNGDIFAQNW